MEEQETSVITKYCEKCNKTLVGKQTKYCCGKCEYYIRHIKHKERDNITKSKYQKNHRKERNTYVNKLRYERYLYFIGLKDCKCEFCGYDKNTAALCFHHKDPSQKKFKLDISAFSNHTMEDLQIEYDKCMQLCHNCHMELHYPHLNKDIIEMNYQQESQNLLSTADLQIIPAISSLISS